MLTWLADTDSQLATSKPVGGLPETAKEQLDKFQVRTIKLKRFVPLRQKYLIYFSLYPQNYNLKCQNT